MSGRITIVVGGQYGSEAKGAIAAHLCETEHINFAVRTGATNAGHTVVYNGERVSMQQLPVGWVNPNTELVLGAGAIVDLDILDREIDLVSRLTGSDVRERLFIDPRAYTHSSAHRDRSADSGRHVLIGATGKGCSEALIDRIRLRGIRDWTIRARSELETSYLYRHFRDTERVLNEALDEGARILLEGTQGQMLDLYLGPYPYTTHKQTGPAQWLLECGLSPRAGELDIVMVVRTFPIRVAGNSGPLPNEISWPSLARSINDIRRVAAMNPIVEEEAIRLFEDAVRSCARVFDLPKGSDGLDQHLWTFDQRKDHARALSELNATAMSNISDSTRVELKKVFEFTTVTKKLRRIAELDPAIISAAARQIRPSRVALTFLNYLYPDKWYTDAPMSAHELSYVREIERICRAPVTMVTRGPAPEHVIKRW